MKLRNFLEERIARSFLWNETKRLIFYATKETFRLPSEILQNFNATILFVRADELWNKLEETNNMFA